MTVNKGIVLFNEDIDYEIDKIKSLSECYRRKIYVYSNRMRDTENLKKKLPGFLFIKLKEIYSPNNSLIFDDNSPSDFFIIKKPTLSKITDKNIEAFQDRLEGYKLVIDDHPFMTKKDIYWSYFPWSFFNRSLMGFPHCYSLKRVVEFGDKNSVSSEILAKKISSGTETTMRRIYEEDFKFNRISICSSVAGEYQKLKKKLFEEETGPRRIIFKLRKFLKDKYPELGEGVDLTDLGKLHKSYKSGCRSVWLSDAKVDNYLEKEFRDHIRAVNSFMETLWNERYV